MAALNGSDTVSKMTSQFTQLTPSDSLKINWRGDSVCSNDGDYIMNWISGGPLPEYENVSIDNQPKSTATDHKPFAPAVPRAHETPSQGSNHAYEIVSYQPTAAHPVRPNPSNRKPLVASSSARAQKLTHSYVNVDIPSDPEPAPPPVPLKKKKPPVKAVAVVNDQSDDSELDEEEGNELQYENWSFLNPGEGDQNMTISELDAYVKSRKLQGLKAEYFKIRNKPEQSEMKICK